jgi:hypothetical protein
MTIEEIIIDDILEGEDISAEKMTRIIDGAKAIEQYVIKARIEELETYQEGLGYYDDRIAELKQSLTQKE